MLQAITGMQNCLCSGAGQQKLSGRVSKAVELDPVSLGILKDKGIYYYYNRQYDTAINMGMMTLELDRNFVPAYRLLSLGYQGMRMFDEAIVENERWGELTGNKR